MKDMNEKIYIGITSPGLCATLGYIITPIKVVRCELGKVYNILNEGLDVYEVDVDGNKLNKLSLDMFIDTQASEEITVDTAVDETVTKKEEVIDNTSIEEPSTDVASKINKNNFKFKK